jgi:hypothetical protein
MRRDCAIPASDFCLLPPLSSLKEGGTYVAYAPALDISSCGATDDEARLTVRDAVRGFLAASEDLGTLDEILRAPHHQHGIAATPAIRPVHFQRLIRVFEQEGFHFDRQPSHLRRSRPAPPARDP